MKQWIKRKVVNHIVRLTSKEGYNPNLDVHLKRSDYKHTPIRKRFPR